MTFWKSFASVQQDLMRKKPLNFCKEKTFNFSSLVWCTKTIFNRQWAASRLLGKCWLTVRMSFRLNSFNSTIYWNLCNGCCWQPTSKLDLMLFGFWPTWPLHQRLWTSSSRVKPKLSWMWSKKLQEATTTTPRRTSKRQSLFWLIS